MKDLTLLDDIDFPIVKKYKENFTRLSCDIINVKQQELMMTTNNNDVNCLAFSIAIAVTKTVTDETIILMDKFANKNIKDLENINILIRTGVPITIILKYI